MLMAMPPTHKITDEEKIFQRSVWVGKRSTEKQAIRNCEKSPFPPVPSSSAPAAIKEGIKNRTRIFMLKKKMKGRNGYFLKANRCMSKTLLLHHHLLSHAALRGADAVVVNPGIQRCILQHELVSARLLLTEGVRINRATGEIANAETYITGFCK